MLRWLEGALAGLLVCGSGACSILFPAKSRDAELIDDPIDEQKCRPTPWARSFGGPGEEAISEVAVGGECDVYICGSYSAPFHIDVEGRSLELPFGGNTDAFIARVDRDGTTRWVQWVTGSGYDNCRGLAMVPEHGLVAAGWYAGTDAKLGVTELPAGNPAGDAQSYDLYVTMLDPATGRARWLNLAATVADEWAVGVAYHAATAQILVAGRGGGAGAVLTDRGGVGVAPARGQAVIALALDGAPLWEWSVNDPSDKRTAQVRALALGGDTVFAAGHSRAGSCDAQSGSDLQATVWKLALADGHCLWRVAATGVGGEEANPYDDDVFNRIFLRSDGNLLAFGAIDGAAMTGYFDQVEGMPGSTATQAGAFVRDHGGSATADRLWLLGAGVDEGSSGLMPDGEGMLVAANRRHHDGLNGSFQLYRLEPGVPPALRFSAGGTGTRLLAAAPAAAGGFIAGSLGDSWLLFDRELQADHIDALLIYVPDLALLQ